MRSCPNTSQEDLPERRFRDLQAAAQIVWCRNWLPFGLGIGSLALLAAIGSRTGASPAWLVIPVAFVLGGLAALATTTTRSKYWVSVSARGVTERCGWGQDRCTPWDRVLGIARDASGVQTTTAPVSGII